MILTLILAAAAALRLVGLPGRGEWDDDQGDEMLTMLHWVRDGQLPDLGPLGSFGTAHHGVGYYWLLAPGAYLTDANPVAAAATLALIGVAGVAACWWLGTTVGGPIAGHVAGLLMAVSPSAIAASTFVWNSNVVGPASALATAAAWHAWRTRQPSWWLVAAVGLALMLHGHLLAGLAVPPLVALMVADAFRREAGERRRLLVFLLGAGSIVAITYLPLLVHELRHDFSETRAIVEYLFHGTGRALPEPTGSALSALPVIAWRVLAWPVSGFVQAAPLAGFPALFVVAVAIALAVFGTSGVARQFSRWAAATTVWAIVALTVVSPSLGVITPGLPNDQYHAWLGPILIATVGVAAAQLWCTGALAGRVTSVVIAAACATLGLLAMPPTSTSGGGWPGAVTQAERIRALTGDQPVAVTGVAKPGTALAFPLERAGVDVVAPASAKYLVVVCDPLFERAVGVPCGGPAETSTASQVGFAPDRLVARFADGDRRIVCLFSSR